MSRLRTLGLAAGAAAIVRRWSEIRKVDPELRTRHLWLPTTIGDRARLAAARKLHDGTSEVEDGASLVRVVVPAGLDAYVYTPFRHHSSTGALLWIHGGGTVLGRPERDHAWCSRIAARTGLVVVNVRYRLAPEHPFPHGFEDCFAALGWLHDHAGELGVDPGRIAVGGGSAGGGLAAAVAQRAHDEEVPVAFQLLVYPMLDDRTRSDSAGRGRFDWTPKSNRFAWGAYLGDAAGDPPPYAVPARREDLTGLAPAWVGVGDLDLFHDEDLAYAERLRAAGVECELHVVAGMYHAADRTTGDAKPLTREFRRRAIDAVDRALNGSPQSSDWTPARS